MRIAYIDCVGGASGDMLLSALVDAGAAEDVVRSIPTALQLPDCSVNFQRVLRGALSALQAEVTTPRREDHRHVPDLLAIIDRAAITDRVKQQARSVIDRLAEAEARIHHSPIESVHLHEVGGHDALIDIVGVLAALENLQIERVVVSPVPLARGWTKSMHGALPLPAPATLTLLEGVPIRYVDEVVQAWPGASYLAAKAGVPVLPVAVTGTEDVVVKDRLRRLKRIHIHLRIGKPFLLPALTRQERDKILQQSTDEMMCQIAVLLPPAYRGIYADHPRLAEQLQPAPSQA